MYIHVYNMMHLAMYYGVSNLKSTNSRSRLYLVVSVSVIQNKKDGYTGHLKAEKDKHPICVLQTGRHFPTVNRIAELTAPSTHVTRPSSPVSFQILQLHMYCILNVKLRQPTRCGRKQWTRCMRTDEIIPVLQAEFNVSIF